MDRCDACVHAGAEVRMSGLQKEYTMTLPRTLAWLALAAWLVAPPAPAAAQHVDPDASELVFVTEQTGVPVEGRFQRWAAEVALDPREPEGGHLGLTVLTD